MQTTRRERKRIRTRSELVSSARALIAENGVASLRVSDVTERSDVALGSFYSHFETKEDIVEAVVADAVTALADAIGDVADQLEDPAEGMSVGARRLVELCHSDPELARLLVKLDDAEARFREMLWPRAYRVMERGITAGRFHLPDADLALTIAIAAVFATIRAIIEDRTTPDSGKQCALILLRAVGVGEDGAEEIAQRPLPQLEQAADGGRARRGGVNRREARPPRTPPRGTHGTARGR